MVTRTTGIEWTDRTWNPTTGCDKVSQGCKHCYAETLAMRLQAMGNSRYLKGFGLTLHDDKIREPSKWPASRVFVNSMSDLLHRDVPTDFIVRCFETMTEVDRHDYHVLTKRPERWSQVTAAVFRRLGRWPAHVLPGTSIENRAALPRLMHLAAAGDHRTVRMVSMEPLLEDLGEPLELATRLTAARIGWVITGGEAGFKARHAEMEWFTRIRDACALASIPFFHKQHGGRGVTKRIKRGGDLALLDGVLHHAHPHVERGAGQASLFAV